MPLELLIGKDASSKPEAESGITRGSNRLRSLPATIAAEEDDFRLAYRPLPLSRVSIQHGLGVRLWATRTDRFIRQSPAIVAGVPESMDSTTARLLCLGQT